MTRHLTDGSPHGAIVTPGENGNRYPGLLDGLEQRAETIAAAPDRGEERRRRLRPISSAEFARAEYRHDWLVKNLLVKGEPAVVGGPRKALKTSFLVDLAVSLSTPRPDPLSNPPRFLGRFEIPTPARVGLFSGESGRATLQETAYRICKARGTMLAASGVVWSFEVPHLTDPSDLTFLQGVIQDNQLEVVIIDPLYLALPGGGGGLDSNNLFAMGSILTEAARVCQEAGATPILAHHARKHRPNDERWQPLELEDLAYSGIQEFARQWLLLSRRERFEPGTGSHRLWMSAGGSAGFGGLWGVDVDEGQVGDDFQGRRWSVRVLTVDEARHAASEARAQRKESERIGNGIRRRKGIVAHLQRHPHGDTQTGLSTVTGAPSKTLKPILKAMVAEGILVPARFKKGRGNTFQAGYKLASISSPVEEADEDET